ncbi:MAG: hypothetical protein CL947_00630 [Epsilonproteobacteria bacterium]|nr:hypothetical protein [Campylobacterota bacterium]
MDQKNIFFLMALLITHSIFYSSEHMNDDDVPTTESYPSSVPVAPMPIFETLNLHTEPTAKSNNTSNSSQKPTLSQQEIHYHMLRSLDLLQLSPKASWYDVQRAYANVTSHKLSSTTDQQLIHESYRYLEHYQDKLPLEKTSSKKKSSIKTIQFTGDTADYLSKPFNTIYRQQVSNIKQALRLLNIPNTWYTIDELESAFEKQINDNNSQQNLQELNEAYNLLLNYIIDIQKALNVFELQHGYHIDQLKKQYKNLIEQVNASYNLLEFNHGIAMDPHSLSKDQALKILDLPPDSKWNNIELRFDGIKDDYFNGNISETDYGTYTEAYNLLDEIFSPEDL